MSCEEGGLWSTTCATERLWVWVADSAYLMRGEEVSWLQSVSRGKEEEREVSNSHTLDSTTPAPVHTQGVKYHTPSQQHFRTLMSQLSCDWNLVSKPFTWIRVSKFNYCASISSCLWSLPRRKYTTQLCNVRQKSYPNSMHNVSCNLYQEKMYSFYYIPIETRQQGEGLTHKWGPQVDGGEDTESQWQR